MIVLGITAAGPQVLARSRVELIDAAVAESKQPYHAVESLTIEMAAIRLRRYMAVAEELAQGVISVQRTAAAALGFSITSVGIIASASRKPVALSAILASHALIHAADGDHFRDALASAAELEGLEVLRAQAGALSDLAVIKLGQPLKRINDALNSIGRQIGPPWTADQKKAALLAWLMTAQ
jgi:hypothetical protein